MPENCDFVVPVNALTLCTYATFSCTVRHYTMYLDHKVCWLNGPHNMCLTYIHQAMMIYVMAIK